MATRRVCGEPEATDPLTTEGLPAGLAGSQPHTYLSQSLPPKKSHREKCQQGQNGLWHLGSILPVKVGVNVSCCHQPRGCCPHLPSAQQDQRPTDNSSLYGPPEPLCCVNKQPYRIAEIKLSNQLTGASLPKVKHFSWVNSNRSHWPTHH